MWYFLQHDPVAHKLYKISEDYTEELEARVRKGLTNPEEEKSYH